MSEAIIGPAKPSIAATVQHVFCDGKSVCKLFDRTIVYPGYYAVHVALGRTPVVFDTGHPDDKPWEALRIAAKSMLAAADWIEEKAAEREGGQ